MLTHELQKPVNNVNLSVETIKYISERDKIEKYLEIITDNMDDLRELVDNFLKLNALDVEDFAIKTEEIDLIFLLNVIVENYELVSKQRQININIETALESCIVNIDRTYMFIAIKNLVDNAIKYSPDNTIIKIILTKDNSHTLLKIKDQGFGIPLEQQEKLFEQFFRVKTKETENIKGSGLGLSFVKRIINLHGARISFESKPAKGTTFIIDFND